MSTGKYNAIRLKEFEGRKTVVCSNHVHVRGEVFYINSQLCLNSPLRLGFRGCKPRTTVMSLSQMLRTTSRYPRQRRARHHKVLTVLHDFVDEYPSTLLTT